MVRASNSIAVVKNVKTSFVSTKQIRCDSVPSIMLKKHIFRWQGSCPGQQNATKISTVSAIEYKYNKHINHVRIHNGVWTHGMGSFCACTQLMRDDVALYVIPSDFGCWLEICWVTLTLIFVFWIFWKSYIWQCMAYFTIYAKGSQHSVYGLISPSATYMHQWTGSALVQVMACRLFGAKPFPEPMLTHGQLHP